MTDHDGALTPGGLFLEFSPILLSIFSTERRQPIVD